MAKLSKTDLRHHQSAMKLIQADRPLSLDETFEAFALYHEGAEGDQTGASAYFTPIDFANDMWIDTPQGGRLLDMCAGIGRLGYFASGRFRYEPEEFEEIVCVEKNPDYVEVGKRLFPEATWICADALDPALRRDLGKFDFAIANPPFGNTTKSEHEAPRYKGKEFDLAVMDVMATLAPSCWAIVPESRARWDRRGTKRPSAYADRFKKATGLDLHRFSSVDAHYHREAWRGTSPAVEIVGFGEEFESERSTSIIFETPPAGVHAMPQPVGYPSRAPESVPAQADLFA